MEVKEPYEKPGLVVIPLKAEEVLAIGCKTVPGPRNSGWPNCGFAHGCNLRGTS
jgi:hypothetical protein